MKKNNDNQIRKTSMGARASQRLGNTIVYVILAIVTVVWLFPFFGILLESFRVETRMQVSYLWPQQYGFDNYIRLFTETDFLIWFRNTGIMGVATAFFQTFFILSMSYTLSRLRFKGRKTLMNLMSRVPEGSSSWIGNSLHGDSHPVSPEPKPGSVCLVGA